MEVNLFSRFKKEKQEQAEQDTSFGIFRDYDIRGVYPEELNERVFSFLGTSLYQFLKLKKAAIGRDSRLSSPDLARSLGESLLSLGVDVVDVGMITAPIASWLAYKKKIDTFFISASHNPPDENGLKIYSRKLGPVSLNNGLKDIESIFKGLFLKKGFSLANRRRGVLTHKDFIADYQKDLLRVVGKVRWPGRLALDYSNGPVGLALNDILDKLGIRFSTINENPNGMFPGHGPNPLRTENHQKIKWLINQGRYGLGAIFDGDGDRIVFFSEQGELISPGQIFALLTDFYLPKSRRSKNVVITSSFSHVIRDIVALHGGKVFTSPVGRTNISPLMRKKRSLMAAELSGHYFFQDFNYGDNAILALLMLINILAQTKKPISKLVLPFKKYIILPEISLPYKEGSGQRVLRAVRARFSGGKASKIDGLTVEYKSWWFNLRLSNTQSLWRLTLEGQDAQLLKEKQAQIEKVVRASSILPADPTGV